MKAQKVLLDAIFHPEKYNLQTEFPSDGPLTEIADCMEDAGDHWEEFAKALNNEAEGDTTLLDAWVIDGKVRGTKDDWTPIRNSKGNLLRVVANDVAEVYFYILEKRPHNKRLQKFNSFRTHIQGEKHYFYMETATKFYNEFADEPAGEEV